MKLQFLIFLFVALFISIDSQAFEIKQFTIKDKKGNIDYLTIGDSLKERKPIILWCQGSLPRPIVINYPEYSYIVPLGNFDYQSLLQKYHIVIISMPHITPITDYTEIDQRGLLPSTKEYENDDYLEKYVERGVKVIKDLKNQKWADSRKIIIIGHSQGSRIALAIASQTPQIKALGYLSGSLLGRYSQFILNDLEKVRQDSLPETDANKLLEQSYQQWVSICREGASSGNSAKSWKSFSSVDIDKLTSIKIPVFIAFGSEDLGSATSALAPVYMELNDKRNYFVMPLWGCGHNFEPIENGVPNYEKMRWSEVIDKCFSWINQQIN